MGSISLLLNPGVVRDGPSFSAGVLLEQARSVRESVPVGEAPKLLQCDVRLQRFAMCRKFPSHQTIRCLEAADFGTVC